MQNRRLGHHGFISSSIALGCMSMSDPSGLSEAAERESTATIHHAIDSGITLLDTGDFYGMGHNEMLIGQALKGRRDKVQLSVKFGALRDHRGMFIGFDSRPAYVKTSLAYSLQRLRTDYIDFYFPARVDRSVPIEDTIGAVADLVREGKVRYIGLSEASAQTIRRANSVHPISALEIEYSTLVAGDRGNDPAHDARAQYRDPGLQRFIARPAHRKHDGKAGRFPRWVPAVPAGEYEGQPGAGGQAEANRGPEQGYSLAARYRLGACARRRYRAGHRHEDESTSERESRRDAT